MVDSSVYTNKRLQRPRDPSGASFKPNPMPGKLNNLQRDLIIAASGFHNGEPVPFCITNLPYQGKASLNGLVTRGLMEERKSFYYLTENGFRVAAAIRRLTDRHWEVREIEEHLTRLASQTPAAGGER